MTSSGLNMKKPVWIDLFQTIHEAEQLMIDKKIDGLLVRNATGRAVGVFTRSDLETYNRRRLETLLSIHSGTECVLSNTHLFPQKERIERWISPHIFSIVEGSPIQKIIREMLRHHIHQIFITSRDSETYRGVVSMVDILKSLVAKGSRSVLAMLFLGTSCALADVAVPPVQWVLDPQSHLSLEGDSTLHKYHSQATQIEAVLETTPGNSESLADLIQTGHVSRMEFTVIVAGLKSGKGQLDKNMLKTLKEKDFPQIHYRMSRYTVKPGEVRDKTWHIEASGQLTVAGQSKDVVLQAEVEATADRAEIEGQQELLMSDFGVKAPVLMMGALKTDNKVVIHYEIVVVKSKK